MRQMPKPYLKNRLVDNTPMNAEADQRAQTDRPPWSHPAGEGRAQPEGEKLPQLYADLTYRAPADALQRR